MYSGIDSVSSNPIVSVTGTDIDVTVLATTANPLAFVLVMPSYVPPQCDYSLSHTAVKTVGGADATSIVTLNQGTSSLEFINGLSTITE